MTWSGKERRAFILGFAAGAAAILVLKTDLGSVVDSFYEGQVERKALAVWGRRAAKVSYEQCRFNAASCLGKIVIWPITRPAAGASYYEGDPSRPLSWSNEAQVPLSFHRESAFKTVGVVTAVHPASIELVFLGSPETIHGGTTWKAKFGLDRPDGGRRP